MKKNAVVLNSGILILFAFLLNSCAQVVAPGGGKLDKLPPRALRFIPDSAQLNFNAQKIEITFDEFIELKDINSQLIISPPLTTNPDISVKNKTLSIVFDKKEKLKPNTTYCISLGNAIKDITENNAKENFSYVFSTGNFIDSISLSGKVQNAFNHKTEKGILVLLYKNTNDSKGYKSLPDYFTKTKEDGTFQLTNLHEGKYNLIALKDANLNYMYDEGESIAFTDSLVNVTQKNSIIISMFEEIPKKLFLKKAIYNSYGKIVFIFNKPNDSISIEPINYSFKQDDVLLDYSTNKDTLNYWFRNIDIPVLKLQVRNGNIITDTLEYKLINKEEALKAKRGTFKLYLTNSLNGNRNVDLNTEFKFIFSHPIEKFNSAIPVELKEDSILLGKQQVCMSYGFNKQMAFINYCETISKTKVIQWKPNTKYQLFIPPATCTDFFGLTNDTIKMGFKTRDETFYGSIKLKLTIPETKNNYLVQLMDNNENIVQQTSLNKTTTIYYQYLHPQNYKIKLIQDENSNGKWDTGNYLQKKQSEKIIYYDGAMNLRSNWDLDLEWKID